MKQHVKFKRVGEFVDTLNAEEDIGSPNRISTVIPDDDMIDAINDVIVNSNGFASGLRPDDLEIALHDSMGVHVDNSDRLMREVVIPVYLSTLPDGVNVSNVQKGERSLIFGIRIPDDEM